MMSTSNTNSKSVRHFSGYRMAILIWINALALLVLFPAFLVMIARPSRETAMVLTGGIISLLFFHILAMKYRLWKKEEYDA